MREGDQPRWVEERGKGRTNLKDDSERLSPDVVEHLSFRWHHSPLGGAQNSRKITQPVRQTSELCFELERDEKG